MVMEAKTAAGGGLDRGRHVYSLTLGLENRIV